MKQFGCTIIAASICVTAYHAGAATGEWTWDDGGEIPANVATYTAGILGQALHFDGKNKAGVEVAPRDAFSLGTGDFTICAWVRPERYAPSGIFRKSEDLGGMRGVVLAQNEFGYHFVVGNGKGNRVYMDTPETRTGEWILVAGVRRGNVFELYIDGKLRASDTYTGEFRIDDADFPVMIGDGSNYEPFQGDIDNVTLIDRGVSQAEMLAMMQGWRLGLPTELKSPLAFQWEDLLKQEEGKLSFKMRTVPDITETPAGARFVVTNPNSGETFTVEARKEDGAFVAETVDSALQAGNYPVRMEILDVTGTVFHTINMGVRIPRKLYFPFDADAMELAEGEEGIIANLSAFSSPADGSKDGSELRLAPDVEYTLSLPEEGMVAVYGAFESPYPAIQYRFGDFAGEQCEFAWHYFDDQVKVQEIFLGFGDFSEDSLSFTVRDRALGMKYLRIRKLTPEEQELASYQNNPSGNKRVIYNNDGYSDYFGNEPWSREKLLSFVDIFKDTDTEVYELSALVSGAVNFPSKFADYYGEGQLEYKPEVWSRKSELDAALFLRKMDEAGLPYYKTLLERTHEQGMKFFGSLRMSAYYWTYDGHPYEPMNGKFWHDHPEFRQYSANGEIRAQMSYAFPEIRRQRIGVLMEMLDMGADGINMDFCRYPDTIGYEEIVCARFQEKFGEDMRQFPASDPRVQEVRKEFMNTFFREVRKAVEEKSAETGKKYTIATRIPADNPSEYGFDLPTIINEKLVDILIPHQPGLECNVKYNFQDWVDMVKGSGIQLYPGIEGCYDQVGKMELTDAEIASGMTEGHNIDTSADYYRHVAYERFKMGADGVFIFNDWKGKNSRNLLGDLKYLERWSVFEDPANLPRY